MNIIKPGNLYVDCGMQLKYCIEADYENAIARAENKTAPRRLIIWGTTDSFSMATSKSFTGDLLKRLGGNNIADNVDSVAKDSGYIPLGMEYIATQDPEAIFVVTHGDVDAVKNSIDENLGQNPLSPLHRIHRIYYSRCVYLLQLAYWVYMFLRTGLAYHHIFRGHVF